MRPYPFVFLPEFALHCPRCEGGLAHDSILIPVAVSGGAYTADFQVGRCGPCGITWSVLDQLFAICARNGLAPRRIRGFGLEERPLEVGVWSPDAENLPAGEEIMSWDAYRSAYLVEGVFGEEEREAVGGDGYPVDLEAISVEPAQNSRGRSPARRSSPLLSLDRAPRTARGRWVDTDGFFAEARVPYFLGRAPGEVDRLFRAAEGLEDQQFAHRFTGDHFLGVRIDRSEWIYLKPEWHSVLVCDDWLQVAMLDHNPQGAYRWDESPGGCEPALEPWGALEKICFNDENWLHPADRAYLRRHRLSPVPSFAPGPSFPVPIRRSDAAGHERPRRTLLAYSRIFEALYVALVRRDWDIATMNRTEKTPEGPVRFAYPARGYEGIGRLEVVRLTFRSFDEEGAFERIEVEASGRTSLREVSYAIERAARPGRMWVRSYWWGNRRIYLHGLAGPVASPRAAHLLGLEPLAVQSLQGPCRLEVERIGARQITEPAVRMQA